MVPDVELQDKAGRYYFADTLALDRGELFATPGTPVYEGMIVGIHTRSNDLPVNPTKAKQLTNIRAAGSDENVILKPPRDLSLEAALEYIEEDELVEITPSAIRLQLHDRLIDKRRIILFGGARRI